MNGNKEYIFTERAHLMCPGMCYGITGIVNRVYDKNRIDDTVKALSDAHPFLCALLGYEEEGNRYYYNVTGQSKVEVRYYSDMINDRYSPVIFNEYEKITEKEWNLYTEGMLKILVWNMGEKTCFIFVFHHLLTDGRGALGLVKEFADLYVNDMVPEKAEERLIASKDDLPQGTDMSYISRVLVGRANRIWLKEGHKPVSYEEYRSYADSYMKKNRVKHSVQPYDETSCLSMIELCHANGITVNDLLIARMMIEEDTSKVIIASDLRSKLDIYNKGAMGNYSTAFSVVMKKKCKDEIALSKRIHKKIIKIMADPRKLNLVLSCYSELEPALLDAAFLFARRQSEDTWELYESKAAEFIGRSFFGFGSPEGYSITNLGKIDSNSLETAYFIPPASPAIRKTWGVLTVNGEMTVCVSERT